VALGVSGLLPTPFAEQFTVNALGASVSAFIYSPIMGAFSPRRGLVLDASSRCRARTGTGGRRRLRSNARRRPNANQLSQKAPAKR
jgi:hypothetical protein